MSTYGATEFSRELANWAKAYAKQVATDFRLIKAGSKADPDAWCGPEAESRTRRARWRRQLRTVTWVA